MPIAEPGKPAVGAIHVGLAIRCKGSHDPSRKAFCSVNEDRPSFVMRIRPPSLPNHVVFCRLHHRDRTDVVDGVTFRGVSREVAPAPTQITTAVP